MFKHLIEVIDRNSDPFFAFMAWSFAVTKWPLYMRIIFWTTFPLSSLLWLSWLFVSNLIIVILILIMILMMKFDGVC